MRPEKIEVSSDMFSKYSKDIADWYDIKVGGFKKPILNLGDKVKYVVHCIMFIGNKIG